MRKIGRKTQVRMAGSSCSSGSPILSILFTSEISSTKIKNLYTYCRLLVSQTQKNPDTSDWLTALLICPLIKHKEVVRQTLVKMSTIDFKLWTKNQQEKNCKNHPCFLLYSVKICLTAFLNKTYDRYTFHTGIRSRRNSKAELLLHLSTQDEIEDSRYFFLRFSK